MIYANFLLKVISPLSDIFTVLFPFRPTCHLYSHGVLCSHTVCWHTSVLLILHGCPKFYRYNDQPSGDGNVVNTINVV